MNVRAGIRLAQQINQRDHSYNKNQQTRHKEAPDKAVNHVFGFKIQRASRTPARIVLQHVSAIPTRLSAHGYWFLDRKVLLYWSR